jgi:hypothetical protein
MTKEKKTTKQGKPSENYILSNNVVINLAGLISKRKSSSKTKSSQKDTQEKQESTAIGRTTPFNNISNLDTQIQQANLRVAENRFQNSSRLPSDTSRTIETSSPQFYTTSLPDDRFREGNSYYNPNDNAGAFGTIEGSNSFQAQGNNIPATELFNEDYSFSSDTTVMSDNSNKNQNQNNQEQSEENMFTQRKYTIDEVRLWLENGKRIDPRRQLKRPATDGRMYALAPKNGKIFTALMSDAVAYGLVNIDSI